MFPTDSLFAHLFLSWQLFGEAMGPVDHEDCLAEQVSRARPLEVIPACGPSRTLPPGTWNVNHLF